MSTKLRGFLVLFGILLGGLLFAQQKTVTGTVTDADGFPLPDVEITSTSGETVFSDFDGNYSIEAQEGDVLIFILDGMIDGRAAIDASNTYNVAMAHSDSVELEGVVVTALGITRDEKALGYSAQKVTGDELTASRASNPLNALSGNVAGVQISNPSSSLGGSTRILLRGVSSLTGENRPLIVIDGVPMNNANYNSTNTQRGAGGRDYGDMAFDMNPDDIESINVLKGGPAAALYGSRGANGVVMITTKSAKKGRDEIILNTGFSVESVSNFPRMQKLYGGGAGEFSNYYNIDGVDYAVVDFEVDESWGPKYDPSRLVLQWNNFDPEFPDDYLKPGPWVYPKNDARSFFNSGITYTNGISIGKSYENTMARFSLSNVNQTGIVPNSSLKRTTLGVSVDNKFSNKLTASADLNYVRTDGFNRPEVGYGDNSIGQQLFQWSQRNTDYGKMKQYKLPDGRQRTWNRTSIANGDPVFADNPYWMVHENTADDLRNRFYGNARLKYDFGAGVYAVASVYGDYFSYRIRDRFAVGGQNVSKFELTKRNFTEMNYEGRLHFDREFGEFSLNTFAGVNRRHVNTDVMFGATQGGLVVPGIYNLGNSKEAPFVSNSESKSRINSVFGAVSLGWRNMIFADFSGRNDWSSTLPSHNNSYFYPAATGSIVFSEFFEKSDILNYGKVRGGWSQVRNDTDPYLLRNVMVPAGLSTMFNEVPGFTNENTRRNPDLKPELISTWEIGLEAAMFKRRLIFDVTYYNKTTEDAIVPVQTSASTGYTAKNLNAGEMVNKGIEALVTIVPIRTNDFEWRASWNFAKNDNEVTRLYGDLNALILANAPFNVSIAAMLGEKYGQIRGTDFVYDDNGNKVVGANGLYLSTPVKSLGSVLPDYNMGFRNSFSYKNITLSALIDIQKGGKFFSTNNMFGHYSGMLEETAVDGIRENGIVATGVTGDVSFNPDGSYTVTNTSTNTTNVSAPGYFSHYYSGPDAQNVFDADYVKLREVVLTYKFPDRFTGPFSGVELSVFGRNLATWGLDNKNWDPEMMSQGSGNIQGLDGGNLPPTRSIGMNLKLQF